MNSGHSPLEGLPQSDVGGQARRYLIIANRTLVSPGLEQLVHECVAAHPCEFHVLVPQAFTPTIYAVDPMGLIDLRLHQTTIDYARHEAEERLDHFRETFARQGVLITGEVGCSDPLAAARNVVERLLFDEIIVSTLPPGVSRWLKMDLANRVQRAFELRVTPLVQQDALVGT
jgi:hypothetical protein